MENKFDSQKFCKDPFDQSATEFGNNYGSFPIDQMAPYHPPVKSGDVLQAVPTEEMVVEGEELWNNSLIVQFVGRVPNFSIVQRMIKQLWGRIGEVTIRSAGLNLIVVQLSTVEARDQILEGGPWHFHNQPLIVRKWEPGISSLEFNLSRLPVWVQLSNLPLELFTQRGIGCVASVLGRPLYMDRITAQRERLAFARVCVEIEVTKEIPKKIEVLLRGRIVEVMVSVPWLPLKCSKCNIFGHTEKDCMKKQMVVSTEEKEGMENKVLQDRGKKPMTEWVATTRNEVGSSSKTQGKAGSINKFTMLQLEEGNKVEQSSSVKSSTNKYAGDSVASLMENIKAQIRKTHVKDVSVSGTGPIPEVTEKLNVIEGTGNGTLAEQVEANQVNQGVAAKESEHKGEATVVEEDSASEDGFDEFNGFEQKSRKKIDAVGLVRAPRLASAGVAEAIKAIKTRNKKCRRQAKKASASK
ncbi:hypothetical protein PTKIN_Ptkin14bG0189800 [Pterospermum kingtungense]